MTDEHITTHIRPPHVPTARCVVCMCELPLHETWKIHINRKIPLVETAHHWKAWHIHNPEDLWLVTESTLDPTFNTTAPNTWSGTIPTFNPTHTFYTYTGHACCEEHAKQGEVQRPWEML